jgi:hypothetical protein
MEVIVHSETPLKNSTIAKSLRNPDRHEKLDMSEKVRERGDRRNTHFKRLSIKRIFQPKSSIVYCQNSVLEKLKVVSKYQ